MSQGNASLSKLKDTRVIESEKIDLYLDCVFNMLHRHFLVKQYFGVICNILTFSHSTEFIGLDILRMTGSA